MFQRLSDPEADARSIMMRQPCICNGERTGSECEHYWFQVIRFATANSDAFKLGDRVRRCLLEKDAWDLQQRLEAIDLPVRCNQYKPSLRQYDPKNEEYDPITPEETRFLEAEWAKRRDDAEALKTYDPAFMLEQFRKEMADKIAASKPSNSTVEPSADMGTGMGHDDTMKGK